MRLQSDMSRRRMLAMAAAGGAALIGGACPAAAQPNKRIEQLDPALDNILSTSQPIEELGSGYGGALGPAEGPLWWKEGGYLLFSDIHNEQADEIHARPGRRAVQGQGQPRQRANPRPAGPACRL